MSLHKSLKMKDRLKRQRSVLTRFERILSLQKDKRWKEGDPIFGLPKVRTKFKIRKAKVATAEEGDAAAEETEAKEKD